MIRLESIKAGDCRSEDCINREKCFLYNRELKTSFVPKICIKGHKKLLENDFMVDIICEDYSNDSQIDT